MINYLNVNKCFSINSNFFKVYGKCLLINNDMYLKKKGLSNFAKSFNNFN